MAPPNPAPATPQSAAGGSTNGAAGATGSPAGNAGPAQGTTGGPPSPRSRPVSRVSQTYSLALKLNDLGISEAYLKDEHLHIFRAALESEKKWDAFYALQSQPNTPGLESANFIASFKARTSRFTI